MKKIYRWFIFKIVTFLMYLSIAMRNVEINALKSFNIGQGEKGKKHERMRHNNQLLEKFYAGKTDEKYVKEYYELLRKADAFMMNSTKFKKEVAADRWGMNIGIKDKYGRRYDHVGFFDDQHKNYGKTMKEVIDEELLVRRTNDDTFQLLGIINNKPIESGLLNIDGIVNNKNELNKMTVKSKSFILPIKIGRDDDSVLNKIEQLTEFLHIKKIGFEHRQLEFFIPLKFKTNNVDDNSEIFTELCDFKYVYLKDRYGKLGGFTIQNFTKRVIHNETHEVWKFHAIEMDNIN